MEQLILIACVIVAVVLLWRLKKSKSSEKRSHTKYPIAKRFPISGRYKYNYSDFLHKEGLEPERFSSHQKFVKDTYSDSLLLGSSKEIVRDDPNDINPYLGLRRPNYDVVVGSGARQVPSEDRGQLSNNRAPSFV